MVGNFRMDFNPYELYAQTYTQKYSHLNTKNSRDNDFFTKFDKYYFALKQLKIREFSKSSNVLGFKTAENC